MTSTSKIYQSRWGYHPCDYELFRKLKFLHKCYWEALIGFHAWHRWYRKEPQNRVGPEPPLCPTFVTDELWHKPYCRRGEYGHVVYPKRVVDHDVISLYQAARYPADSPVEPFDAATIARVLELFDEVNSSR